MKIADNFFVYFWNNPKENNCNSYVIDGKVPVLIDPGLEQRVDNLFDRMREDGFDPNRIQAVIGTHCHPDHFTGSKRFVDTDVKVALTREEEKFMIDEGSRWYAAQGKEAPPFEVTFYLKEGDLRLGKHEFEVFIAPGHSPGSLCLYWPKLKTLICGDVIFRGSIGRVDLPGGNAQQLKQSIEKLSKLKLELILPGHGPAIQGTANVQANFQMIESYFRTI
ncbi:MAG: MBL fold metallo-hydrolase [Deltaproteobacteria bacterium]|nr:MBL fold metallo-hydrolase [Deltaproteobacteria bacterium]